MFYIHLSRSIAIDIKVKPDTQVLRFPYTNHEWTIQSHGNIRHKTQSEDKQTKTKLRIVKKKSNIDHTKNNGETLVNWKAIT